MVYSNTGLPPGESWIHQDPFTISASCYRIYQRFESLARSGNNRESTYRSKLQKDYSSKIFKCDRLFCSMYRAGFDTEKLRDTLCLYHSRPFKCDVLSCEFAVIGFTSRRQSEEHWLLCHKNNTQKPSV